MSRVDSLASPLTTAVARLPPSDAWAAEVLQGCARAHYTPQRDLLRVLAPLSASTAATTGRATRAVAGTVIDVDAEEDDGVVTAAAIDSPKDYGNGSYQPYLPSVARTAPTAETQMLRTTLSPALLRKAYRLSMPCVTKHVTKGDRRVNCAAAPRCMAGLQMLSGDSVAREDCLQVIMGDGPRVLALPAGSKESAAVSASAVGETAAAGVKGSRTEVADVDADAVESTATDGAAALATTRTVQQDPSFPCLWRGVRNLTNTCYFSSVLQMVFSVARLRHAILSDSSDAAGLQQLAESGLRELFALMAFSREGAGADPKSFATYLSLDVTVQQDAQEFFTLLLDWLRCHCGPAVQAAVTSTFSGTLLYDRRCGACGRSAKRAEPFLYLSLPVRPTLEDSLSEFSRPEEVDGFMCEGCGKTAVATSRQYMRTLPDVLVVHWNRFEFDLHTLQRHKVTTATSFPLQLDMATYMRQWHQQKQQQQPGASLKEEEEREEEHLYELRGVVNHLGDTAVSGHYTYHGKVSDPSSSSAWLNFNDAEVSKLNRYQGQRGTSADAYLLVYHRVSGTAATSPVSAASPAPPAATLEERSRAVPTTAVPTPAEYPVYLRQYVDRVNERCLDERREWLAQRAHVAALFDLWASTAKAVFDASTASSTASPSAWGAPSPSSASAPPFYVLPTAWLQQLGRFFLPAYVDVATLGGGAESQRKRSKKDGVAGAAPGSAGGAGNGGAQESSEGNGLLASGMTTANSNGDASTLSLSNDAAEGTVVTPMGPLRHGHIKSVEELYQCVRQHSLLQALPSLSCPHGYIAPWGPYKVVSGAAYAKLAHFLTVCDAPLKAEGVSNEGSGDAVASPDVQRNCAFVEANLCPLCVAAMAATVQALAISNAEDEEAECCLTRAWRDAERKKEAEECGAASSMDTTGKADPAAPAAESPDDEEGPGGNGSVLVSESVVEGWASYYANQLAWNRVRTAEGFTGVLVMKEARLSAPRAPSSGSSGNEAASPTSSFTNGGEGSSGTAASHADGKHTSASPASPTSPTFSDAPDTYSTTVGASTSDLLGIAALNVDRGDLNLSEQLLCVHGVLRAGQHVLPVPASLRRYWVRRFAEVLTIAHRSGQLRTSDPRWSVSEEDIEHFLLPYIPASTTSTTCPACMWNSVQTLTSRQHHRLRRLEERKRFPTLWLAGAMTSPAGVAQLLHASGAENEGQLLAAQHPNRLFFKQQGEREYREYVKRWTKMQEDAVAEQEAEVKRLQTAVEEVRKHDTAWHARVTTRRGGGGRGGGAARGGADSLRTPDPKQWPSMLEQRYEAAKAALEEVRARCMPDATEAYGCVPTWWVAQWFAALQDDDAGSHKGKAAPTLSTPNPLDSNGSGSATAAGEAAAEEAAGASLASEVAPIGFEKLTCEHGGCLLEMPWLNPSDGFWQGVRAKRAEAIWNGVQVERATAPRKTQPDKKGSGDSGHLSETAAPPSPPPRPSGPTRAEYRSQCWLPPLVIVPMDEYLPLLAEYGSSDMLRKVSPALTANTKAEAEPTNTATRATATHIDAEDTAAEHAAGTTAPTAEDTQAPPPPPELPAAADDLPIEPVPEAVIQVRFRNGVRELCPSTCAACCARLLSRFEVNCQSFVNGSLKLNLHIKKSRKNFYDATSVLTSSSVQQARTGTGGSGHASEPVVVTDDDASNTAAPAPQTGNNADEAIPDGIHYYTTLAQLRTYISAHLREKHGFLVPVEALQIARSKNKALKLRADMVEDGADATAEALEQASLQDLGIRDGEALFVQCVDVIAQPCATAAGNDEEWEAIPPELLHGGGASGAGRAAGGGGAREHAAAFRETRLQGSVASPVAAAAAAGAVTGAVVSTGGHASAAAAAVVAEEQPTACPICTFLNAPGMVVCEMCEAPLPTR